MIKNLVAFGCSLTYGHGLKDCFEPPTGFGPEPSKLAWPQLLADKFNLNCVNLGSPGSGNTEILHKILNYDFTLENYVIVLWSFPARDIVFDNNGEVHRLSAFDHHPHIKAWTKLHSDYDCEMRTWICIHHAYHYLTSLNVKFDFMKLNKNLPAPKWTENLKLLKVDPERLMKYVFGRNDLALDNSHPGESFHKMLVDIIYKSCGINITAANT